MGEEISVWTGVLLSITWDKRHRYFSSDEDMGGCYVRIWTGGTAVGPRVGAVSVWGQLLELDVTSVSVGIDNVAEDSFVSSNC